MPLVTLPPPVAIYSTISCNRCNNSCIWWLHSEKDEFLLKLDRHFPLTHSYTLLQRLLALSHNHFIPFSRRMVMIMLLLNGDLRTILRDPAIDYCLAERTTLIRHALSIILV